MNHQEQITRFINEVDRVVDHYRKEYDLSYADVIGCLELVKFDLIREMERMVSGEEN
jgi:hypothetical protein